MLSTSLIVIVPVLLLFPGGRTGGVRVEAGTRGCFPSPQERHVAVCVPRTGHPDLHHDLYHTL